VRRCDFRPPPATTNAECRRAVELFLLAGRPKRHERKKRSNRKRSSRSIKPKEPRLSFKRQYTVSDLTPPQSPYSFDYGGPHAVKVLVRAPSTDEVKSGYKQYEAFCIASSHWPISEKNREIFDQHVALEIRRDIEPERIGAA
jgi:hypothetical protein